MDIHTISSFDSQGGDLMASAGNVNGGVMSALTVPGITYHPFSRQARLDALCDWHIAHDWPIENSLQEQLEADPDIESVLDHLPPPEG